MDLLTLVGAFLLARLILVPLVLFFGLFTICFAVALWGAISWLIQKVGGIHS